MSSFNADSKWLEAKRTIGVENSWIEIISYYRSINGENVFVYAIGDGDKKLIVDVIDEEDNILLINKNGDPEVDTYENVMNSKKEFIYSKDIEYEDYYLNGTKFTVPIESHNKKRK